MAQASLPLDGGAVYGRQADLESALKHLATMHTAIDMNCPRMAGWSAQLAAHHFRLFHRASHRQEAA